MTTLQTPQEFVTAVRQQRLVEAARLKGFVTAARGQAALTARRIADRAVTCGLLTRFQADEVLAGRADLLVLGDYRLLARLGEGETGGVYLAEHAPTGERRAVKLLHDEHAGDPAAGTRLGREAAAVARLCHPNVVRVFEYDPGDGDRPPFLAMEYVDGVSLQAAVALAGTFTAEATAECGRQAALALQHAWDAGLVHRDVKPANLLLARDGQVKVFDFGQVRASQSAGLASVSGKAMLGTAAYVAPEQVSNGSGVDCRADVFALGGTLYFLLAGHPPFSHADALARLRGKQPGTPRPVHHLRPDVPAELSAVVSTMLAHRPDRRPPTPAAVAHLLARWADPSFADDLFARLSRPADTLPDSVPLTPGPVRPTDRSPAVDSTADVPVLRPEVVPLSPQETVRVARPTLVRPASTPERERWVRWLMAGAVALVLCVAALIIAFLLTR